MTLDLFSLWRKWKFRKKLPFFPHYAFFCVRNGYYGKRKKHDLLKQFLFLMFYYYVWNQRYHKCNALYPGEQWMMCSYIYMSVCIRNVIAFTITAQKTCMKFISSHVIKYFNKEIGVWLSCLRIKLSSWVDSQKKKKYFYWWFHETVKPNYYSVT